MQETRKSITQLKQTTNEKSGGHRFQRYCIYIDGANLNQASKNEGILIDYNKLKSFLYKNRNIQELYYYDTTLKLPRQMRFHSKLSQFGYTLKLTKIKQYGSVPISQKLVDTRIVADSLWEGFNNKYDAATFISGDKDILPAVEYIMKMGKAVEIMAFWKCLAWVLRTSGAKLINLTNYKDQLKLL